MFVNIYKLGSVFISIIVLCGIAYTYHGNSSKENSKSISVQLITNSFVPGISTSQNNILMGVGSPSSPVQLEWFELNALKLLFHGMVTNNQYVCSDLKKFGRNDGIDGGYDVCMSGVFTLKPQSCLVYSFGVSKEWSFDEKMSSFGCRVHSFDPSIGLQDHIHAPNVSFHNMGLWESNFVNENGWKMRNLMSIKKRLGHLQIPIDVLKVDTEGAEWPLFRELIRHELNVKQLIVEIHTPTINKTPMTKTDFIEIIQLMANLQRIGFQLVTNYHRYICCGAFAGLMPREFPEKCCHELSFVNTRYLANVTDIA